MLFMACYNDKMPQRNERKATFIESGILLLRLYTQSSHPHPPTVIPFAFSGSLALHEQRKRAFSPFVCLPYKSHWKLRFKVQITSMGGFNTSSYACCPTPPQLCRETITILLTPALIVFIPNVHFEPVQITGSIQFHHCMEKLSTTPLVTLVVMLARHQDQPASHQL